MRLSIPNRVNRSNWFADSAWIRRGLGELGQLLISFSSFASTNTGDEEWRGAISQRSTYHQTKPHTLQIFRGIDDSLRPDYLDSCPDAISGPAFYTISWFQPQLPLSVRPGFGNSRPFSAWLFVCLRVCLCYSIFPTRVACFFFICDCRRRLTQFLQSGSERKSYYITPK